MAISQLKEERKQKDEGESKLEREWSEMKNEKAKIVLMK